MQKSSIGALALVGCLFTAPAMAEPFWYVGGSAGATQIADFDNGINEIDFDYGYSLSARLGAYLTPRLRLEGEFDYLSSATEEINNINFEDDLWIYGGSANVLFDFVASPLIFTPFIGAGIGYVKLDTDNLGSDTGMMGKAIAGLSFSLPFRIRVEPAYQLMWLNGEEEDIYIHMLRVSFTLGLN